MDYIVGLTSCDFMSMDNTSITHLPAREVTDLTKANSKITFPSKPNSAHFHSTNFFLQHPSNILKHRQHKGFPNLSYGV